MSHKMAIPGHLRQKLISPYWTAMTGASTVDIGYMVLGYMVISAIWSIFAWDRFP